VTDNEKLALIEAATLDAISEAVNYAKLSSKLYEAANMARDLGRQDLVNRIDNVTRGKNLKWTSIDDVIRVSVGFNPEDYDYFNGSNHYSRALLESGAPCGDCGHIGPKHEGLYEACKVENCDCTEYLANEKPLDTLKRLTGYKDTENT
jgi:hypothetical protein